MSTKVYILTQEDAIDEVYVFSSEYHAHVAACAMILDKIETVDSETEEGILSCIADSWHEDALQYWNDYHEARKQMDQIIRIEPRCLDYNHEADWQIIKDAVEEYQLEKMGMLG